MADQKLTTVHHPFIEDMQGDVPTEKVDEWVESGWKKSKPKSAVAPEEPAPTK